MRRGTSFALVALVLAGWGSGFSTNAGAQTPPVSGGPAVYKRVPAVRWNNIAAYQAASELSRTSGATVLVSSSLATTQVKLNSVGGSVDTLLQELVATLPKGTVVRAAFVPVGPGAPTADAVGSYLDAQDVLRAGTKAGAPMPTPTPVPLPVPEPTPFTPGEWEVLGHRMPLAKATVTAVPLDLQPVYLVTLPKNRLDPVAKASLLQAEGMRTWLTLSPDQRNSLMDQQLTSLLNMPSSDRQSMLGQFMQQGVFMMQKMSQLPEGQRQQFMEDIKGAAASAGLPTGPPPAAKP